MFGTFLEHGELAYFTHPVNLQTASNAATTGDWLSMANYHHLDILLLKGAGTASDDPTITVLQATSAAGAGSKALNFARIIRNETTTAAGPLGTNWTITTGNTDNDYTHGTSAESVVIWVIPIESDELDVQNGFFFVNVTIADVGTNDQFGCILGLFSKPRYIGAPSDRISVYA